MWSCWRVGGCVVVVGGGAVGVLGGTQMVVSVFLTDPDPLLLCLVAGAWSLVNGVCVMLGGCSLYHHATTSDRPSGRRLLVLRLSLASTALVLTLALVMLHLHEAGVYRWTTLVRLFQHSQLPPTDQGIYESGVWMVTTTSVAGTTAAVISLASTFWRRPLESGSPCLNRVTMLSAGWVYEPSPRPLTPDTRTEKGDLIGRPDLHQMQNQELLHPCLQDSVLGTIPTIAISHALHTDISSNDFPDDSFGKYDRILCSRPRLFEKAEIDKTAREDLDGAERKSPLVNMLSFGPKNIVKGERCNRHDVSCENKTSISSSSLTQVLHLVQTNTWSSPSALNVGNNGTTLLQETKLRDVSPIPKLTSTFRTTNSITVRTKLLMSHPTSSTPEKSSSRCPYEPSASHPTYPADYSQHEGVTRFSADVSIPLSEGQNICNHSSSEIQNINYHGAEVALHHVKHEDPSSSTPATSVPQENQSTSKSTSAQSYSSRLKSLTSAHERSSSENEQTLSKVKKTNPVTQSVTSAHGQQQSSSTPQTVFVADKRKEVPTQSNEFTNTGCWYKNQASGMMSHTTGRRGKPTPPTRSPTTHLTSTRCSSVPTAATSPQLPLASPSQT